MTEAALTRWRCVCAYDGTAFAGWQSQPGGTGIQDVLEARIQQIVGQPCRVHGSGRTDAGVHARGQVFHFDAAWRHGPERLRAALRVGLPRALQIKSVRAAAPDFHARFSATGKRYVYHLFLGDPEPFERPYTWALERPLPLRLETMIRAADLLRGQHDFSAYSASNGSEHEDPVRTLSRAEIRRAGRRVRLIFEADGFLYKMVRSLVGALVAAGEDKLSLARIEAMLHEGRRTAEVQTAPPQGLFLDKVFY